jgi:hypothetical protein
VSSEGYGIEGLARDDAEFQGSRFSAVRKAIWANPYQEVWGAPATPPFEVFPVTFGSTLRGLLPGGKAWLFLSAAKRTLASQADLRWGPDGKGYRRLLHPSGVCLTGLWEITEETPYSGYFKKGSRGLCVARYSSASQTRRGKPRSLAMVGRIYPTTDPDHAERLPTANFITQEDIGGARTPNVNRAVFRNAPDTTPFMRGFGVPVLLVTGIVLQLAEKQPTFRQVYQIAELGKPPGEPTRAPAFLQITMAPGQPVTPGDDLDFRDEVMAQIYDPGDPAPKRKLVFRIETSDTGVTKGSRLVREYREVTDWRFVGTMTFTEAVASFNGDRVLHFNHPPWREDRNDPATAVKPKK